MRKNIEFECPNCGKFHSQKWEPEGVLTCECDTLLIWKDKEKILFYSIERSPFVRLFSQTILRMTV